MADAADFSGSGLGAQYVKGVFERCGRYLIVSGTTSGTMSGTSVLSPVSVHGRQNDVPSCHGHIGNDICPALILYIGGNTEWDWKCIFIVPFYLYDRCIIQVVCYFLDVFQAYNMTM